MTQLDRPRCGRRPILCCVLRLACCSVAVLQCRGRFQFQFQYARRSIASMSLSSLRFIWPSCAAEYSAARAPWRQEVSGGTMNTFDWGGSDGMNSSEIVFCHHARISSVPVIQFSQSESAHYHASCDLPKWVELPIYVQCQHRSITPLSMAKRSP
jgi:hypothetical protein